MKGVKELKRRLRGVNNIKKITKAMELVAATKLRRLQERTQAMRPYAAGIEAMIGRVAGLLDPGLMPLLQRRERVADEALVVVGADRGLCGSYNSNLFRHMVAHLRSLQEEGVEPHLCLLGRRVRSFAAKYGDLDTPWVLDEAVEKFEYNHARRLFTFLSRAFLDGTYDRVRVIFTAFRSMASYVPTTKDLLPVTGTAGREEEPGPGYGFILEPSPRQLMERLLPRYLEMELFAAVLEALTSEFASRQVAMKNATDNAEEMTDILTMEYNKARQWSITADLLDIVGGAEALRG